MLKNISILFISTLIAQLIQLAIQPFLANILDHSEFNFLGKVLSLASMFVIFGNLQIHTCLVVSNDKSEQRELFTVGFAWLTGYSIVIAIAQIGYSLFLGNSAEKDILGLYIGIAVWITGTTNLLVGYYSASGEFRRVGVFSIGRALAVSTMQFFLAQISFAYALVLGLFMGEFFIRLLHFKTFIDIQSRITLNGLRKSFSKYQAFIIAGTAQEFVSVVALMAPLFLFGEKYGDYVGGSYALAYRMTWAPGMLIASSVSSVMLKDMSGKSASQLKIDLQKSPFQSLIIFFSSLLILISISFLLDFWLDKSWDDSVEMMHWISFWVSTYLASLKARQLFRVLHLQRFQLAIDLFVASGMISIFYFFNLSWHDALVLSSSLGVLQNIFITISIFFIFKKRN